VRARGDAEFEALWGDWHRHVLAYALRRADRALAEDVVAETFVIAWRRIDDVPDPPLPWLLGVARRVLANQRRGERRRGALVDRLRREPRPVAEPPPGEDGRVLAALAALPEPDREALLLHAWEGLDHAAAGTVIGCSANAFAVRLHRARARFADALTDLDRAGAGTPRVAG
jgi:RNA polymerase sigma-70 factor (ECF subfamily)